MKNNRLKFENIEQEPKYKQIKYKSNENLKQVCLIGSILYLSVNSIYILTYVKQLTFDTILPFILILVIFVSWLVSTKFKKFLTVSTFFSIVCIIYTTYSKKITNIKEEMNLNELFICNYNTGYIVGLISSIFIQGLSNWMIKVAVTGLFLLANMIQSLIVFSSNWLIVIQSVMAILILCQTYIQIEKEQSKLAVEEKNIEQRFKQFLRLEKRIIPSPFCIIRIQQQQRPDTTDQEDYQLVYFNDRVETELNIFNQNDLYKFAKSSLIQNEEFKLSNMVAFDKSQLFSQNDNNNYLDLHQYIQQFVKMQQQMSSSSQDTQNFHYRDDIYFKFKIKTKSTFFEDGEQIFESTIAKYYNDQSNYLLIFENKSYQQMNYKLKEINLYKDNILATVSHDLRAPLNAILGMIEASQEFELPEEVVQYLKEATSAGGLLLSLINDILDSTQIKNGTLKLDIQTFNVKELSYETAKLVNTSAKAKDLDIKIGYGDNIQEIITSDPRRLTQILLNFLTNAIKFTIEGEISICITKAQHRQDCLKFSVADTGIGIPPSKKDKLFKEFGRLDDEQGLNKQGIGLGLNICKKLVSLLGPYDEILLISEENKGSQFIFYIYTDISLSNSNNNKALHPNIDNHQTNEDQLKNSRLLNGRLPTLFNSNLLNCQSSDETIQKQQMQQQQAIRRMESISARQIKIQQKYKENSQKAGEFTSPIKSQVQSNLINIDNLEKVGEVKQIYKFDNNPIKLLLVDDAPYNINVITTFFKDYPLVNIDKAFNGQQAIDKFNESIKNNKYYDLVIMDCQMPIKDGFEATREIRDIEKYNNLKNIPIMALTSHSNEKEVNLALEAGMTTVVKKPCKKKILLNIIDSFLSFGHNRPLSQHNV